MRSDKVYEFKLAHSLFALGLLLGPITGTGTDTSKAATVEPFDPKRRLEFGELYDPDEYRKCRVGRKVQDLTCERYLLRRHELPPHFPYAEVPPPSFPTLPENLGAHPWLSAKKYFDYLCDKEAGQFIYRTAEGVHSVFQMRPRLIASDLELADRYVMPDPYGYTTGEAYYPGFAFVGEGRFQTFETTLYERPRHETQREYYHASFFSQAPPDARYIQYSGYDRHNKRTMTKRHANKLISRYGYMWREVQRPRDREHGIAGGELIVLDLKTNEILALWRGYQWSEHRGHVWWKSGLLCPSWPKDAEDVFEFVSKVLKPAEF